MIERHRVIEHRLTRVVNGYSIFFWIEEDPGHGGVSRAEAERAVAQTIIQVLKDRSIRGHEQLAKALIEAIPPANSVEVCDALGDGTAMHRDRP